MYSIESKPTLRQCLYRLLCFENRFRDIMRAHSCADTSEYKLSLIRTLHQLQRETIVKLGMNDSPANNTTLMHQMNILCQQQCDFYYQIIHTSLNRKQNNLVISTLILQLLTYLKNKQKLLREIESENTKLFEKMNQHVSNCIVTTLKTISLDFVLKCWFGKFSIGLQKAVLQHTPDISSGRYAELLKFDSILFWGDLTLSRTETQRAMNIAVRFIAMPKLVIISSLFAHHCEESLDELFMQMVNCIHKPCCTQVAEHSNKRIIPFCLPYKNITDITFIDSNSFALLTSRRHMTFEYKVETAEQWRNKLNTLPLHIKPQVNKNLARNTALDLRHKQGGLNQSVDGKHEIEVLPQISKPTAPLPLIQSSSVIPVAPPLPEASTISFRDREKARSQETTQHRLKKKKRQEIVKQPERSNQHLSFIDQLSNSPLYQKNVVQVPSVTPKLPVGSAHVSKKSFVRNHKTSTIGTSNFSIQTDSLATCTPSRPPLPTTPPPKLPGNKVHKITSPKDSIQLHKITSQKDSNISTNTSVRPRAINRSPASMSNILNKTSHRLELSTVLQNKLRDRRQHIE